MTHINGTFATPQEQQMALPMTATMFIPLGKGGSLAAKAVVENVAEHGVIEVMERGASEAIDKGAASNITTFTKDNFRKNLVKETGFNPGRGFQAHHVFPQKFRQIFEKIGINIDDPKYGAWWSSSTHQSQAYSYNQRWAQFLKTNPSKAQILEEGRVIMSMFGLGNTLNY